MFSDSTTKLMNTDTVRVGKTSYHDKKDAMLSEFIWYVFNPSHTFNMLYYSSHIVQCNNPVKHLEVQWKNLERLKKQWTV
jgi:hypothetical protein